MHIQEKKIWYEKTMPIIILHGACVVYMPLLIKLNNPVGCGFLMVYLSVFLLEENCNYY